MNFQNFMTLVGPPVLFQQRVKASNDCGTAFAAKWLKRAHEEAIHNRCSPPMECSDHVRSEVNSYMSCRGGPDEDAGFFGSTPLSFEDNVGFVDFLVRVSRFVFIVLYRTRTLSLVSFTKVH